MKPQTWENQTESEALTQSILDLLTWVLGGNNQVEFENVLVYIQCDLLRHRDLDLAADFLRFQPSTAWSTYIKGRLELLGDRPSQAAIYFKKAAYKLSRDKTDYHGASNGLLTQEECGHFGADLTKYYLHILRLFNDSSYLSQVIEFAHLALQQNSSTGLKSNADDSRTLLEYLFKASLETTSISTAFSALVRHPNPQGHLLGKFITKILSSPQTAENLLTLPFPPRLYDAIDQTIAAQTPSRLKILASWRMRHNDFRGAAAALLRSLNRPQKNLNPNNHFNTNGGKSAAAASAEGEHEANYLTITNLLACAGKGEDWMLSTDHSSGGAGKRQLVTLQDLRMQRQRELDQRSMIETGNFAFGGPTTRGLDLGETASSGGAQDVMMDLL